MSDENTREQPNARGFEERVFARLDSIDARLEGLEEAVERRAIETRPIWERALAAILAARQDLEQIDVRLDRMEAVAHDTQAKFHSLRADFNEMKKELREHFPFVK